MLIKIQQTVFLFLSLFFLSQETCCLRILFVSHEFPKPIQPFIINQVIGMIDRGHEVYIYATKKSEGKVLTDVKEYGLNKLIFYHVLPKDLKPDLMICEFGEDGLLGLKIKEKLGYNCPMITCFRGRDLTVLFPLKKQLFQELFKKCDLFLPVSRSFAQRLSNEGCDKKKILVLHSAINLKRFGYSPLKFIKEKLKDENIILVSNSRLVEKKGLEYAIRAIAALIEKYPNLEYRMIGDGVLRGHLESLVSQLRIKSNVKFYGWQTQEEIVKILKSSHIFIHPAVVSQNGDEEGIPNSIKEAMAVGRPVVSTRHGGISELVDDGVTGFLVEEKDVEGLKNRIEYLINHQNLFSEMGIAGRKKVEEHFNMDIENNKLDKICRYLVSGRLDELILKDSIRGCCIFEDENIYVGEASINFMDY